MRAQQIRPSSGILLTIFFRHGCMMRAAISVSTSMMQTPLIIHGWFSMTQTSLILTLFKVRSS
ncbi:hypothetical protein OR60_19105 [Xanthomonas vesicatoria]|nr:hypothetical protein OR60_19105 [Xanthomonas vesicatoria]